MLQLKMALNELIPILPILYSVSDASITFASRLSITSLIWFSIPTSPQTAKLLSTRLCRMIAQYAPHGDDLFLLRSTYSSSDVFTAYSMNLLIPLLVSILCDKSSCFSVWFSWKQLTIAAAPSSVILFLETLSLSTIVLLCKAKAIIESMSSLISLLDKLISLGMGSQYSS